MSRYSFESSEDPSSHIPPPEQTRYNPQQQQLQQQQPPPPTIANLPTRPGAHPESSFDRLRAVRRHSRENTGNRPLQNYGQPISPVSPPSVPLHRDPQGRYWGQELGYTNSMASNTTPGADNFGEQAAGGIAGIANAVADANARESGLEAMRGTPGYNPQYDGHENYSNPHGVHQGYGNPHDGTANYSNTYDYDQPHPPYGDHEYMHPAARGVEGSQSSLTPLGPAAVPPAISRSPHSFQEQYSDTPYNRYSRNLDPTMGGFDPNSIEDDGDDGLEYTGHNRGSIQNLSQHPSGSSTVPVGAAAATGGVMGALGGLVSRTVSGGTPQYNPVSNPQAGYDLGSPPEKSEWLKQQSTSRKRWKWVIATTVILLILGGIAAGVAIPLVNKKSDTSSTSSPSSGASSGDSASTDTTKNGDLNKDSSEIKALMNNKNLHKVFPGMDYTPINTQYPDCLANPPSQNNVTRDLAILSQLTNVVRLYGTDCNQTEMLLHSIDQLGLKNTVKVWLGVWQDKNETTNARQLSQMYKILSSYGTSPFLGVIVGNEVLFNQFKTEIELETIIRGVKANFTTLKYDLPVATSDLGDKWTATLASSVDYLMANVHPFFAGVEASIAASWTVDFFNRADAPLASSLIGASSLDAASLKARTIISETGWPSAGGTDCGAAATCTAGSVAGISEMNTFLGNWVCQALTNGTNYFWFEAFDEPWKVRYNEKGKEWEDKWGLMDTNRNLKSGVIIPDCGGKTVGPA